MTKISNHEDIMSFLGQTIKRMDLFQMMSMSAYGDHPCQMKQVVPCLPSRIVCT